MPTPTAAPIPVANKALPTTASAALTTVNLPTAPSTVGKRTATRV